MLVHAPFQNSKRGCKKSSKNIISHKIYGFNYFAPHIGIHGSHVGRILFDGAGGVLTNTLPVTLTGYLSDLPDASAGLVYMGDGRWFDPMTGHALQPSLNASLKGAPQSLNRYTVTPVGQPGVQQASDVLAGWIPYVFGFTKNTAGETIKYMMIASWTEYTQRATITIISDVPLSLNYHHISHIGTRWTQNLNAFVDGQVTSLSFSINVSVKRFGQGLSLDEHLTRALQGYVQDVEMASLAVAGGAGRSLSVLGELRGSVNKIGFSFNKLDDFAGLRFGRTVGIGLGLDFVAGAYFQSQIDKPNPFLTPSDRIGRAAFVGIGEAAGAFLLTGVICGTTGGLGCLVIAGVAGGVVGNQFVTNFIFPSVFTDEPNLRPR